MTLQIFESLLTIGGEKPISAFFKEFPRTLIGQTHVDPSIVMCELTLANGRRPDFVYIERTSQRQCLHIVEIEDPAKPIFNERSATFSKEFRKAIYQIEDYICIAQNNPGWIQDLTASLRRQYKVDVTINALMGHLVYGRRGEVETSEQHQKRWGALATNALINVQTYDRLIHNHRHFFRPDYEGGLTCVVRNHEGFRPSP